MSNAGRTANECLARHRNLAIAGAGPWNAFTLHRVWVRGDQVTGIDHIVSDEFESTSIGLSKIAARR
ncbi:MAG TPA: hypothetical protein VFN09_13425 [Rhodanobacteraceae bacterium]|nr:hypothetical protein [Rhodanobacteraceae bacterium]